ncbi:enoyl-CoA hydratase [Lentzea sp. NBRC 105346]|uniref:MaoC family dehydratase n=1 Tax=Lentzea sp. NBRC 105346 TaxID=3032205 RepID=UPI0024A19CAD|nr:MaoC family dehydratase [Lentzea sp. NBRC 105346]GLZ29243.1 enoyl-CoA hydratase [Lentzea sp. NBRC 105346]
MSDFSVPIDDRYFEDYVPGAKYEFGSVKVDEQRIIEFAEEFDPQSFHVDAEAAATGPFGGLIASGWHTTALMMRLFADHYLSKNASLGGPGVDELRWLAPVRPGDVLGLRVTVLETRRSESKPDRGLVRTLAEMVNQDDVVVLRLTVLNFLKTRS